jgi:ElaB/YqjD/DUF883 family membrane-anchored ribosome-binding protein
MESRNFTMADPKDHAKDAMDQGANQGKKVTDAVTGTSADALRNIRDAAEPLIEQAQAGYRQVAEQARERFGQGSEAVRRNPGPTVGAALGLGLVFGIVIGLSIGSRRF